VKTAFGAILLSGCVLWAPAGALAQTGAVQAAPTSRSPAGPPLISGDGQAVAAGVDEGAGGAPETETDPLVGNGLDSPLCKGLLGAGEL
jgi:hypothetical protein